MVKLELTANDKKDIAKMVDTMRCEREELLAMNKRKREAEKDKIRTQERIDEGRDDFDFILSELNTIDEDYYYDYLDTGLTNRDIIRELDLDFYDKLRLTEVFILELFEIGK